MRISQADAYGKLNRSSEMLQAWHDNRLSRALSAPNINDGNFRLAQSFIGRLVSDVQLDHRLVVRLGDDPIESPRIQDQDEDSMKYTTRLLKPWTQLQLVETELITFDHGEELFLGTKDVKIAVSSLAKLLSDRPDAVQIMTREESKRITAKFTKGY